MNQKAAINSAAMIFLCRKDPGDGVSGSFNLSLGKSAALVIFTAALFFCV